MKKDGENLPVFFPVHPELWRCQTADTNITIQIPRRSDISWFAANQSASLNAASNPILRYPDKPEGFIDLSNQQQ